MWSLRQDMSTTVLSDAGVAPREIGGGYEWMARRWTGRVGVLTVGRLLLVGRKGPVASAQAGWVHWQPWRVSPNVPERRASEFDWQRRKS